MNGLHSDVPQSTLELIKKISHPEGETKVATINALVAILNGAGVNRESLHQERSRDIITAIHTALQDPGMKKYIQDLLDGPQSTSLHPLIRDIFLGTYLISPELKAKTQGDIETLILGDSSK